MSEFESLNSEHQQFEQMLQQLKPVEPALNAADLMFRAGQEAARRETRWQLRRWQLSTLATSVCALVAVSFVWFGAAAGPANESSMTRITETVPPAPTPEVTANEASAVDQASDNLQTVADVNEPESDPQTAARNPARLFDWWQRQTTVSVSADESYIDLRNRVLRDGVDALPEPAVGSRASSGEPLTSSPLRVRDALDQTLWNQI